MGRSQKNKKRHAQHAQPNFPKNKRRKQERFWIENCAETKVPEGQTSQMEVLITRVELTDDYRQVPKTPEPAKDEPNGDEEDESSTKKERPGGDKNNAKGSKAQDTIVKDETSNEKSPLVHHEENALSKLPEEQRDSEIEKSTGEKTLETKATGKVEQEDNDVKTSKQHSDNADGTKESKENDDLGPSDVVNRSSQATADTAVVCVKRSKGAKRPIKKILDSVENFKPLPNGDCGDGVVNPYPKQEVADKFWSQRRRLFTRFDQGIQLDKESWYSVTPEAIGNHIAAHLVEGKENVTILDPFSGCGGNAIAFALRKEVSLVVCVDTDLEKLKRAASNARIYEVPKEKMVFIHDNACRALSSYKGGSRVESNPSESNTSYQDTEGCEYKIGCLDLLPTTIDIVFLSPPWGGMDYGKVGKRNYDLTCIKVEGIDTDPVDGDRLLDFAANAVGNKLVALFLPRNINGIALGKSASKVGYEGPIILEQNVLNGKLKTVTAYLGLGTA